MGKSLKYCKKYLLAFILFLLFNSAVYAVFSISGYIEDNSSIPISNVTVKLMNLTTSYTVITDSAGFYQISNLPSSIPRASYTLTPKKNGWVFSPLKRDYMPLLANETNQDFFGDALSAISGYVLDASSNPIAGITVTLSGDSSLTAQTDSSGFYSFTDLPDSSTYIVTPACPGRWANPLSRLYPLLKANRQNQDYIATNSARIFSISGSIFSSTGAGLPDIIILLAGDNSGACITDNLGRYEIANLAHGSYLVRPSSQGHTFVPAQYIYYPLNSDLTAQIFNADVSVTTTQQSVVSTDTVRPPELHFGPMSAVIKKIEELKKKTGK